jgi:hypothetical protein
LYDVAQNLLQRQLDAADVIDGKINNSFTGSVAFVALLAAVFALKTASFTGSAAHWFFWSLIPPAVITIFSTAGTVSRHWHTGPTIKSVTAQYRANVALSTITWRTVRSLEGSFELNNSILVVKDFVLRSCYVLLVIQAGLSITVLLKIAT